MPPKPPLIRHKGTFGTIAARPPAAAENLRIGLLGGTFDPPHAAHLLVSQIALRRLKLDRIWWLVTPGNPLKRGRTLPSIETRAAQCRALARDPRIIVTTFEQHLPTSYTAATVTFLKQRAPRARFVWLMGADGLAQFHRWHQWRSIFNTLPVAVVDRPGQHLKAIAAPAAASLSSARLPEARAATLATHQAPVWCLLTGPLSPLSSTELRLKSARLQPQTGITFPPTASAR